MFDIGSKEWFNSLPIEELEEGNELIKHKIKCYVDEDDDGDYVILFEDTIFSAGFNASYQEAYYIADKWNKKVMRDQNAE
jgi:hypothetical protein